MYHHQDSVFNKPVFGDKLDDKLNELVTLARDMEDRIQEFFSISDTQVGNSTSNSRSRSSAEIY